MDAPAVRSAPKNRIESRDATGSSIGGRTAISENPTMTEELETRMHDSSHGRTAHPDVLDTREVGFVMRILTTHLKRKRRRLRYETENGVEIGTVQIVTGRGEPSSNRIPSGWIRLIEMSLAECIHRKTLNAGRKG